tara:strand:- start:4792 stop:5553 length:762 start_codon:yes stop_codon:yes gene_type:complete
MSKAKKKYGPDIYKRNEHGLLDNVNYIFNDDGSVNWRAMIKPEFLYPNKDWFNIRKKPVPDSIEGLEDRQLLIMLGGIKELAKLRGYISVDFDVKNVSASYVTAKCTICWSNNYETANDSIITYTDFANASELNTDDFCMKFLETIACNRAFVRCVRNYLNVHIVGADEIDKSKNADNSISVEYDDAPAITPTDLLEKILKTKHNVTSFNDFKSILRDFWKKETYRNEQARDWSSFEDISAKDARKLIAVLKK